MNVLVRTDPRRSTMAEKLSEQLRSEGLNPVIVCGCRDPEKDFRDLCRMIAMQAEQVVILEDDAWPCPDFGRRLADRLDESQWADVVQLWSNRASDLKEMEQGEHCITRIASQFSGLVGIACKPSLGGLWYAHWLSFSLSNPQHPTAWDICLADLCKSKKLSIACTIPSLVQHLPVGSLLGSRSRNRQSRTYRAAFGLVPGESRQESLYE